MQSYTFADVISPDLSEAYILFTFNTDNNSLNIVNYYQNYSGPNLNEQFPTGEYNFTDTVNTISIDLDANIVNFEYEFEDGNLILKNQPESGGSLIKFTPKDQNCINNPFEELSWLNSIKTTMEQNMQPNGSYIIQYVYNGECVYVVDSCYGCPDGMVVVYNSSNEVICEFGGIAGLNTCPDFYDLAEGKRYLFRNNQPCDEIVIISESLYNATDEQTITNLSIDDSCLNITYEATGCDGNSWVVNLIDSEEIVTNSNDVIPQRNLKLSIERAGTITCMALVTQEKSFNISNLRVGGSSNVILNIQDQQILYEY